MAKRPVAPLAMTSHRFVYVQAPPTHAADSQSMLGHSSSNAHACPPALGGGSGAHAGAAPPLPDEELLDEVAPPTPLDELVEVVPPLPLDELVEVVEEVLLDVIAPPTPVDELLEPAPPAPPPP